MKKKIGLIIFTILFFVLRPNFLLMADDLAARLSGRILLAVENSGEAWYLSPKNAMRYFLKRPSDAFALMREENVEITNADLRKIPVGLPVNAFGFAWTDSDSDGLPDNLEDALGTDKTLSDSDGDGHSDKDEIINGYNPIGPGVWPIDFNFAAKQSGRIFLAVENNGAAWYINPADNHRYYLGRPADAFNLMRKLGLGISNRDLENITAYTPDYILSALEQNIYDLINQERIKAGLSPLKWNDLVAAAAREHSQDLANENQALTGMLMSCNYPLIHHEGFNFGIYSHDRLNAHNFYAFGKSGENIALMPAAAFTFIFNSQSADIGLINHCQTEKAKLDAQFDQALASAADESEKLSVIKTEINRRSAEFKQEKVLTIKKIDWDSREQLAQDTVRGWMDSPGHRENILTPDFDEAGVGIAYVNGYIIATQDFIKRASCGFKNGACCEKEGYYPYCYEPLECVNNVCSD